ncbi:MAG: ribonuclease III [Thermoanaerobaculia bacterium]|nr:ribonuclease III [Thermoanaerobaculia bacterium]
MSPPSDWLRRLWGTQVSEALRSFEGRIGHAFRDYDLLRLALTHRSYANEMQLRHQNERLEFLGDAVLDLVTAAVLYARHPDLPEGELSRRKSYLVSATSLAAMARDVELGRVLRLGVGEDRSGGRRKPSLLADALEAVFGAVYLDGGLPAATTVIRPLLERQMRVTDDWDRRDAKTRLQELLQASLGLLPRYVLIEEDGPDHAKVFTVECRIEGEPSGIGTGTSKKAAEQAAAGAALENEALLDRIEEHS